MSPDGGYVTAAFVAVVAMTMVGLLMLTNVLAVRYAEGVLQAAVESGARQGLAARSANACVARTAGSISAGLGGLGSGVGHPRCTLGPGGMTATVDATFAGWLPVVPATSVNVRARAGGVVP